LGKSGKIVTKMTNGNDGVVVRDTNCIKIMNVVSNKLNFIVDLCFFDDDKKLLRDSLLVSLLSSFYDDFTEYIDPIFMLYGIFPSLEEQ
jgi:hypothetical protein